jgi:hypothetical protein
MGPLKTLPYLVMFLMSNAGGWTGDALILKQHKGVAAARKAVNTLGRVRLPWQCCPMQSLGLVQCCCLFSCEAAPAGAEGKLAVAHAHLSTAPCC